MHWTIRQGVEFGLIALACGAPIVLSLLTGKTVGMPNGVEMNRFIDRKASPEAYWTTFVAWMVLLVLMFLVLGLVMVFLLS